MIFDKKFTEITKEDIDNLILNKIEESLNLEYKSEPKHFGKCLSAFANTKGGIIIYGIKESSNLGIPLKVAPIKEKELIQMYDSIRNAATPPVHYEEHKIAYEDGFVIILKVYESKIKPHITNEGIFYKRNKKSSDPMKYEEVRDLILCSDSKLSYIRSILEEQIDIFNNVEDSSENKVKISYFIKFMKEYNNHEVFFPNLNLDYTVTPIRDLKSGYPKIKKVSDIENLYIVKLDLPYFSSVARLSIYEKSPLRENEYYFCKFIDGDWHMSTSSSVDIKLWHRFHLSQKFFSIECVSANRVMLEEENEFKEMTFIGDFVLRNDGNPLDSVNRSGHLYRIYQDSNKDIFLQIDDSMPKKIFYTTNKNLPKEKIYDFYNNSELILIIEKMRGYAYGEKLENIKKNIQKNLKKYNINPKIIPFYMLKEEQKFEALIVNSEEPIEISVSIQNL